MNKEIAWNRDEVFIKSGVFNPLRQFEFTNITDSEFSFKWDNIPIKVAAHETIELPHHLAVRATTDLVDKIMQEEIHVEEVEMRAKKNDPYWRSPKGPSMAVPAVREVYERKILKEIAPGRADEARLQIKRHQFIEGLKSDTEAKAATPINSLADLGISSTKEFEDINIPK